MSEVTTQAKPERRKRQKLEDMEGYKPSIYGLTRDELIDWAMEHGEKKFRAAQIWEWLYRKRVQSFEEMTNLSKDLIAKLMINLSSTHLSNGSCKSQQMERSSTSLNCQMVC